MRQYTKISLPALFEVKFLFFHWKCLIKMFCQSNLKIYYWEKQSLFHSLKYGIPKIGQNDSKNYRQHLSLDLTNTSRQLEDLSNTCIIHSNIQNPTAPSQCLLFLWTHPDCTLNFFLSTFLTTYPRVPEGKKSSFNRLDEHMFQFVHQQLKRKKTTYRNISENTTTHKIHTKPL